MKKLVRINVKQSTTSHEEAVSAHALYGAKSAIRFWALLPSWYTPDGGDSGQINSFLS